MRGGQRDAEKNQMQHAFVMEQAIVEAYLQNHTAGLGQCCCPGQLLESVAEVYDLFAAPATYMDQKSFEECPGSVPIAGHRTEPMQLRA